MRYTVERVGQPRIALAIVLLGLTGGLIVAYLLARDQLVGADARAYWGAVRTWLAGGNPYDPVGVFMPYSYAPWTLILFVPWALLPWQAAWFAWQVLTIALFAWTVVWAYRRRPLATAVLVAALGVPLAANFDTGNVGLLLVLGIWLAWFTDPRIGGLAWALGAALKWLPVVLVLFIPPRARLWGVALLGPAAVLTLATWPLTLQQIDVVLHFPRPLRLDYLLILWGAVPWLWHQPWPLPWLDRAELARRWRERPAPATWLRRFFGLEKAALRSTA